MATTTTEVQELFYKDCSLTTVGKLKESLNLEGIDGQRELLVEAFEIWCDSEDVLNASVKVTKEDLILDADLTSDATTAGYPVSLSLSSYDTLSDLVSAIEGYDGWTVLSYVSEESSPEDLVYKPQRDCGSYQSRAVVDIERLSWIRRLIDRVSVLLAVWCRRDFCYHTHVDIFDGDGSHVLFLGDYPVHDISSVRVNGSLIDDYTLDKKSGILHSSNVWPEGFQNIEVHYTAGYKTIPVDLSDLACEIASVFYHKWGSNPQVILEKIGTYRMELMKDFLTPSIRKRLSNWVRWEV